MVRLFLAMLRYVTWAFSIVGMRNNLSLSFSHTHTHTRTYNSILKHSLSHFWKVTLSHIIPTRTILQNSLSLTCSYMDKHTHTHTNTQMNKLFTRTLEELQSQPSHLHFSTHKHSWTEDLSLSLTKLLSPTYTHPHCTLTHALTPESRK